MSLYSEIITSYWKDPQNKFEMMDFTVSHNEESRLCGDTIEVFLKIENWKIIDFSFIWNTSIITTACASIFGESIVGINIEEIFIFDLTYITELVWEISSRRKYAAILWLLATKNALHKFLWDWILENFSDIIK